MKIINNDLTTYVSFADNVITATRTIDNTAEKVTIKDFTFKQLERFTVLSNEAFKALSEVQEAKANHGTY